jgi:hypothetical protein
MQSGAFIQLVLALAAIASRMFILMPEIQEALALGWAAGHAFLQALNVSKAIHFLFPSLIPSFYESILLPSN